MKKNLINIAVAGLLGMAAFSAAAEDAYQGAWYALPGVSAMNADKDLNTENATPGGFLRFGKELSEHWDVQIGLSHNQADEDSNQFTGGKYKQTLLGVDALYLFSREKFRPFLLAGIGAAQNNVDYSPSSAGYDDHNTSWMANAGLGFQYLFTERLGMQADLRHVWSRAEVNGDKDTIGNNYLNLGVIWRFGVPEKVAEAAPEPVAAPAPAPEPEPAPAPAPAEPVGPAPAAMEKVTLQAEVLFGFDKDNLKEEGKRTLDTEVVEKLKAHPEIELVLITGHTDRIGTEKYNQNLSERRANSVKKYLISQGIDASRLHTVGKGESEPVVDPQGVRGKKLIQALQPNRRVVVEVEVQRAGE